MWIFVTAGQSSASVLACSQSTRKPEARATLPDRAFHLQLDQPFELDAVFHGELAHEFVDEPIYAQAHRLRLAQTALLHVENLLRADLANAGFVLHGVTSAAHGDGRISVRAGRRADEQRIALGM